MTPTQLSPAKIPDQSGDENRPENRPLRVRRASMRHGWYWLIEGFMLWGRSPAFLSFLAFSGIIVIFASLLVPHIGEVICSILMPALTLGIFNGCRAIDRKRKLSPGLLISGFRRRHIYDLLLAGFCNFIVLKAMSLGTTLIDGGALRRVFEAAELPDMATIVSPSFLYPMLFILFLHVLWGMAYLFVPQLIGWWRLPVSRALSLSLKGCLRNWLPFFAYIFCFGFFVCTLSALVINFFNLIMEGLGIIVCVVFVLTIIPVLLASFYVAARDIYGLPRRKKRRHRHQAKAPQAPQAPQETPV